MTREENKEYDKLKNNIIKYNNIYGYLIIILNMKNIM